MNNIEFDINDNIIIYKGTTPELRDQHNKNIEYQKTLISDKLFTEIKPSTLTAQGLMSNIAFEEQEIIDMLDEPSNEILMIGCNYGEVFNPNYNIPKVIKRSGRGRKPKPKTKTKRRVQGTGKYFSSQITFLIKHPVSETEYKIKLFRNGVFQVPGVQNPSMTDLIQPINILREYLEKNFNEKIKVMNFMAVMRNYKSKLVNKNWHVDLEKLEECIIKEKSFKSFLPYLKYALAPMNSERKNRCMKFIGKTNPMNIAEVSYNTDRHFCLILKFYRPMPYVKDKKTTVKLLKKGKINFDGANSEIEVLELYHWIEYIYHKYKDEILVDITTIKNNYNENEIALMNFDDLIYSEDEHMPNSDDEILEHFILRRNV